MSGNKKQLKKETWLLAYMPVFHAGWENLFKARPDLKKIALLPGEALTSWSPTSKDKHALSAPMMREILSAWCPKWQIVLADSKWCQKMRKQVSDINLVIVQQEGLLSWVEQNLGTQFRPEIVNIFVKWDRKNATSLQKPLTKVLTREERQQLRQEILALGQKSSDWWRQVGCILLLANGEKIMTYNAHLPEEQTPYMIGDARAQFHRGEKIELTTAIHAEAWAIATASQKGWSTHQAKIMVSDFPCPVCAKLIVASGIKELYFHRGYSMLDGETILKQAGVKIRRF